MRGRGGASVVEAVVALLLGLFVVHLALTTTQRLERYRERAARRHDALLSTRVARTVLRGELARSGGDWSVGQDSLGLRAFRGTAVLCQAGAGPAEVVVAYRGDRLPEPTKDSAEVIVGDGGRVVLGLRSAEATALPCAWAAPGESVQLWRLDGSLPAGAVVVRVFETGSYHLTGSALRYRVGAGGRQPLTPEVWRDAGTGFDSRDSLLFLDLAFRPGHGPDRSGFLTWIDP